jgi:hypothetical protein
MNTIYLVIISMLNSFISRVTSIIDLNLGDLLHDMTFHDKP